MERGSGVVCNEENGRMSTMAWNEREEVFDARCRDAGHQVALFDSIREARPTSSLPAMIRPWRDTVGAFSGSSNLKGAVQGPSYSGQRVVRRPGLGRTNAN